MDSSYIATIEEQGMILSERHDSSYIDNEVVDVRNSDEPYQ
jgi:hypothetical protein